MSGYTTGPWFVSDDGMIRQEGDRRLWIGAPIDIPSFEGGEKVTVANARIMAAAPELLQAIKAMERLIVELYPGHLEPEPEHLGEYQAVWSAVMKSRAAIAKAEAV